MRTLALLTCRRMYRNRTESKKNVHLRNDIKPYGKRISGVEKKMFIVIEHFYYAPYNCLLVQIANGQR